MTEDEPGLVPRQAYDESLLRLYSELGRAYSYGEIVSALRPEISRMLGYDDMWLQLVSEEDRTLLMLDMGGRAEGAVRAVLQDERFSATIHREDFVIIPIGEDPWVDEILHSDGLHVTEDARTHPGTNKDLIAVTGQRTVVCLLLKMAERTTGVLGMGTFFDDGVKVPDEQQLDYLRRLANHVAVAVDRVRFLGARADTEAALERTVERLQFSSFLLDSVMDGVIVRDAEDWSVRYVNDAMCRLTGKTAEELLASREPEWARPEDRAAVTRYLESVRDSLGSEMEAAPDGNGGRAVQLRGSLVEYMGRRAILTIANDVSERKAAQETIEYMALHDPLTDLANRALLRDRLELAVAHTRRSRRPLALVFLDVDDFKIVNDSAGHAVGDLLLQGIAQRLRAIVRADDTVARFGGDEFTLILPEIESASAALAVAEKIVESFDEPFKAGAAHLGVTASIGVAIFEGGHTTVGELLRNADLAMCCAKQSGRNTYRLYDPSMDRQASERHSLQRDLLRAIAEERLHVHFQPIVSLSDGTVLGAEALCRWTHTHRGAIPPSTFIPLAEETGAICDLGEWVLREACREAALWQLPGRELPVSVNLSPLQLTECAIVDVVSRALDDSGLSPSLLRLEITETMAMRDAAYFMGAFNELREMGVRIAIDDFGTGYSSLDYLTRFPIDTVKVDTTFVRDVCTDMRCLAITGAVVSLAQALGIEAIAEGVETEEQRLMLYSAGCMHGQGFLFSPAVSAEEFRTLALQDAPQGSSAVG